MDRSQLHQFITRKETRATFIAAIASETERYGQCLGRRGASCEVLVTGDYAFEIQREEVVDALAYLRSYPDHVADYVATALLLDDQVKKDDRALQYLEDFTS